MGNTPTPEEVLAHTAAERVVRVAYLLNHPGAIHDLLNDLAASQAREAVVRAMAQAEQFADKGHYDLAADMMWREPFVKTVELAALAYAMAMDAAPSRGDWGGFRVYF